MLFEQQVVRFANVKQNEVFCTPDDGEMYKLVHRGAKSLDGYGDFVRIEPHEEVRLSYTDTVQRRRIDITLEFIRRLVARDWTFFSSVCINADKYKGITHCDNASTAWSDSMFFHVPGKAMLLIVRLHYDFGERSIGGVESYGEHMYWTFDLVVKGMPYEEQFKIAQLLGTPMRRVPADNYGWSYDDVPKLPLFQEPVDVPGFQQSVRSSWLEGTCRMVDYRAYQWKRTELMSAQAAHDSIRTALDAVIPFVGYGQIAELGVDTFPPKAVLSNCEEDFWKQFNSSYLRKVVRRPVGLKMPNEV